MTIKINDRAGRLSFLRKLLAQSNLRTTIALTFALSTLLFATFLSVLIGQLTRQQIEQSVSDQMFNTAQQTIDKLDRGLFERYRDMQIASMLLSTRELSLQESRILIDTLQQTYADYSWIGLTDETGMVLVSTGQILEGTDVSMRPWFIEGLSGPFVGDVHAALLLEPYVSNPTHEPLRLIDISFPVVNDEGEAIGILGAHLNWQWVHEVHGSLISPADERSGLEVFIVSTTGEILFGPEGVGAIVPANIYEQVRSDSNHVVLTTWPDGQQYLSGFVNSAGYREYSGLGWAVLVRQPAAVAFAPSRQLSNQILISGIILGMVFATFGWILAGWIVRPLQQIAAATKRIEPGDTAISIPQPPSYSEAMTLSTTLRELLTKLNQEINERAQANQALQQSTTELQLVINSVPEGVLLLKGDGQLRLTNPIADQYLDLLAPVRVNGYLTHLGDWELENFLTSPPQGLWHEIVVDKFVFEGIARPVENSSKNTGWVLVLRDVTEERAIQTRTQRQERLAAIGQLAAGIAHDFNNILAIITLYAQVVLRKAEMPEPIRDKLITIDKQAKRAADLIQQILDFSRQSVMERHPFNLLPLLKEQLKLLERTLPEDIKVELLFGKEEYIIHGDPSRIQQVIMNLAINARDAMMQHGGRLQIALSLVQILEDQSSELSIAPSGNWVQIVVADSGSGIPPEALKHIFEPFFTTKEVGKGTGLGLAQVYGIMQQHEGGISVTTQEGEGTAFTLYFPVVETAEKAIEVRNDSSLELGQEQTVLVVEDNPIIRQALAESLALLNYKTIEAKNGRDALTKLVKTHEIAVILSDTVMPEMGGVALMHALQEQKIEIPIILLTGHPMGNNRINDLYALGLAGWLAKPFSLTDLSQLLTETLSNNGG